MHKMHTSSNSSVKCSFLPIPSLPGICTITKDNKQFRIRFGLVINQDLILGLGLVLVEKKSENIGSIQYSL